MKGKRLVRVLLVLALCVGLLPVMASAAVGVEPSGSGTANAPYQISNESNLRWLAEQVNSGTSFANQYFQQTTDITLAADWAPIGSASKTFAGSYDGQNKVISGLTISSKAGSQALFGGLSGGACIENVTLSNVSISDEGRYTAGIAAYAYADTADIKIKNCHVASGSIYGDGMYIGGILGWGSSGATGENGFNITIENCTNTASITAAKDSNDSGGIVGHLEYATVKNCINFANVNGKSGTLKIGGICGAAQYTTFQGCANHGDVSGSTRAGIAMGSPNSFDYCLNTKNLNNANPIGISSATYKDCYFYTSAENTSGTLVTLAQISTGEVAWLLGDYFGQNIGTDNYPVLLTESNKVHQVTVTGDLNGKYYVTTKHTVNIPNTDDYIFYNGTDVFKTSSLIQADITLIAVKTHTHSTIYTEAKAATCTEDGNVEYWYCSECEKYFSDEDCETEITNVTVGADGHSATYHDAVAPTYDAPGNVEYWYCSVCKKYFSDATCTKELAEVTLPPKTPKVSAKRSEDGMLMISGILSENETTSNAVFLAVYQNGRMLCVKDISSLPQSGFQLSIDNMQGADTVKIFRLGSGMAPQFAAVSITVSQSIGR